jgi:hypothetical protein
VVQCAWRVQREPFCVDSITQELQEVEQISGPTGAGVREGAMGDTPYSLGSRRALGETGPEVRTMLWGEDGGPGGRAGVGCNGVQAG